MLTSQTDTVRAGIGVAVRMMPAQRAKPGQVG